MYLHLGRDYIVPLQTVVAVFDMDTATASKRTRGLLSRMGGGAYHRAVRGPAARSRAVRERAGRNALPDPAFAAGAAKRAEKGYAV